MSAAAQPFVVAGGPVLLGDGWSEGVAVRVDGGRVAALSRLDDASLADLPRHDLAGRALAPGYVDAQVNGGGDVLFNDEPTPDGIARIAAAHRRYGTCALLPTLITDDRAVMRRAIAAVDAAIAAGVPGVIGIHLEGPFLAPERKGVHDPGKFRVPDAGDLELLASLRRGRTLVTLAPERVAPEFVAALVARGVVVAAGHSAADYATTRRALAAGLSGFTHLYNAMSPLTSREPGVVGAALDDAASACGLIVDGHHVHAAAMRIALRAKPRGRVFLVTDAMPPVGGRDPRFSLGTLAAVCRDGLCVTPDGVLAGSALDMATAVRNAVAWLGVPLAEAVRMASSYVADFLRLEDRRHGIVRDAPADFVELAPGGHVAATWIAGRRYAAEP